MSGQPSSDEQQPMVTVEVVPPGPGFWASLLWVAVLFAAQLAAGMVLGILALILAAFSAALRGMPLDASALQKETTAFLRGPITLTAATFLNVALAVIITGFHFKSQALNNLALHKPRLFHLLLALLATFPLTVVSSEVNNCVAEVVPSINAEMMVQLGEQPWLLLLVAGCILPAIGEEILFRGFIGRGLVARLGVVGGIGLTSFLFAVIHVEPRQASSAFVLGIAMHLAYLATKSLLIPMAIHFLNNVVALSAAQWGKLVPIPGFSSSGVEEIAHTPPLLIFSALITLVALAILFHQTRARWMTSAEDEWSLGYTSAEAPSAKLGARLHRAQPSGLVGALSLIAYLSFVGLLIHVANSAA